MIPCKRKLTSGHWILHRVKAKAGGFTLIELVAVLAMLGVGIGIFYTTLYSNWSAYSEYIARADLWQEMDAIVEDVTFQAREAHRADISGDGKVLRLSDNQNQTTVQYTINNDGRFHRDKDSQLAELSKNIVSTASSFKTSGRAVVMSLAVEDDVLGRRIQAETLTEVYPRN